MAEYSRDLCCSLCIQFMPPAPIQQAPLRRSRRTARLPVEGDGGFVGAGPAWAAPPLPAPLPEHPELPDPMLFDGPPLHLPADAPIAVQQDGDAEGEQLEDEYSNVLQEMIEVEARRARVARLVEQARVDAEPLR